MTKAVALLSGGLVLAMPAMAAAAPRGMNPVPHGNPGDWFDADSYPPAAIRAERQGRVVVALGIDSAGAVATCVVKVSSGTAALDEGTCAIARERGRFDPATDGKGRPTAGEYLMPVRWALPDTPPPSLDLTSFPARRTQAVEIFFNAAGVVTSCRVIEDTPVDDKGNSAMLCPSTQIGRQQVPMTRDGKPVAYKVVQRMITEVTPSDGDDPPASSPPVMDGKPRLR